MKKRRAKGRAAAVAAVLLCVLLLSACASPNALWSLLDMATDDAKTEQEIAACLTEDFDVIAKAVRSGDYEKAEALDWIISVSAAEDYVDFYCGGNGMGSQTNYTGFFYTAQDNPLAMWYSIRGRFQKTGTGYEYAESTYRSGGDDEITVVQLRAHYYYYFLHF